MRARTSTIALFGALACTPVGSLGKDLVADTSTSTSTRGSDDDDTSGGSTTGEPATTETSAEATTAAHDSTSMGSSESTGAPVCPPLAEDNACTTCAKGHCCDQLTACHADATCLCLQECHDAGTAFPECEMICGADPGEHAALELCLAEQCTPACPIKAWRG